MSTNETSRTPDRSPAPAETDAPTDNTYPPQLHAGAVGYGPEYGKGAGTVDKLHGLQEELTGKVLRKPDLVQHGRELRTGGLKRKEREAESGMDPFTSAGQPSPGGQDKEVEEKRVPSATTAPEGTGKANEQTRKMT